jgi:hypothetical protein
MNAVIKLLIKNWMNGFISININVKEDK